MHAPTLIVYLFSKFAQVATCDRSQAGGKYVSQKTKKHMTEAENEMRDVRKRVVVVPRCLCAQPGTKLWWGGA